MFQEDAVEHLTCSTNQVGGSRLDQGLAEVSGKMTMRQQVMPDRTKDWNPFMSLQRKYHSEPHWSTIEAH
jgi:hypothetical protein